MSDIVTVLVEAKVKDAAELRAAMAGMVGAAETEDGCLAYEWSLTDDAQTLLILERYTNADAALAHLPNVGPHFPKVLAAIEVQRVVLLNADDRVKGAFADFSPTLTERIGGFTR